MFDSSVIIQLEKDVGVETLSQLFQVFRQETSKLSSEIMLCDTLDENTVRICHSLKSSSRSYGAVKLANIAESLEKTARSKDPLFFEQRKQLPQICADTLSAIPKC